MACHSAYARGVHLYTSCTVVVTSGERCTGFQCLRKSTNNQQNIQYTQVKIEPPHQQSFLSTSNKYLVLNVRQLLKVKVLVQFEND